MNNNEYKLSDTVIGHIAQMLQMAILTGTDIVYHFRMIRLEPSGLDPNELVLTKEYSEQSDSNMEKLLDEAQKLSAQMEKNTGGFKIQ